MKPCRKASGRICGHTSARPSEVVVEKLRTNGWKLLVLTGRILMSGADPGLPGTGRSPARAWKDLEGRLSQAQNSHGQTRQR